MRKYNIKEIAKFWTKVENGSVNSISISEAKEFGDEVLTAALILAIQKETLPLESDLKNNIKKIVDLIKALTSKKCLYNHYLPGVSPLILAIKYKEYQSFNPQVYEAIKAFIPKDYIKQMEIDAVVNAQNLNRILSYKELLPKGASYKESKYDDADEKMGEADHKSSPSSHRQEWGNQLISHFNPADLMQYTQEQEQEIETSLISAASFGSAVAQNQLGEYYFMLAKNEQIEYYRELEKRSPDYLEKIDSCAAIRDKAIKLFEFAASQNFPMALYNLGRQSYTFGGVAQRHLVLKYYGLAAAENLPQAQADLGYFYQHNFLLKQNFQEAIHFYNLAKIQGYELDPSAELFLKAQEGRAILSLNNLSGPTGVSVPVDSEFDPHPPTLLKRNGINIPEDPNDQYELALNYFHGRGCRSNLSVALELFSLAAARGKIEALVELGWHYYNYVVDSKETGILLFRLAAAQNGESVPLKEEDAQRLVFEAMHSKWGSKDKSEDKGEEEFKAKLLSLNSLKSRKRRALTYFNRSTILSSNPHTFTYPSNCEWYDLVLMSINDKQKIDLQRVGRYIRENAVPQGKPILIMQGEEFSIYGVSEQGEWQLTHGLKLNASEFKEFKYESQSEVKPINRIQTKGGGDCALHAILGEWEPSERQVVCADIKGKREQVRKTIVDKDNKEPLRGLIVAGIKELIMSGRNIGKSNQALLNAYRRFVSDQKNFTSELWPRFEAVLQQHLPIMEYIQRKHGLTGNPSLRDQFYNALNQNEGELYARMLSLPELHGAFQEYNQLQNTEFDWDSAISAQVRQEYANFVGAPHAWLLPSELAIIANVFHVSVVYYPSPGALALTLNPGEQSTVEVQFNGVNHFERLRANNVSVSILPGNRISKEVYQEITSKKGHAHGGKKPGNTSAPSSSLDCKASHPLHCG